MSDWSRRRCRVALLPDCHVQPGHCVPPTRPTKRLYGAARQLLESTLARVADMDVDAVILLGDTLDPADDEGVAWLRHLIDTASVAVYPVIGNHEVYGGGQRLDSMRPWGTLRPGTM